MRVEGPAVRVEGWDVALVVGNVASVAREKCLVLRHLTYWLESPGVGSIGLREQSYVRTRSGNRLIVFM